MQIDLAGKTAVVTGGNTGIGRAIALALAHAGADVGLTYFSNPDDRAVAEIRALAPGAIESEPQVVALRRWADERPWLV